MVLGHTTVVIQDMLGITPETLDAVDVVLGAFIHQGTVVTDRMMLPVTLERLVAAEGMV